MGKKAILEKKKILQLTVDFLLIVLLAKIQTFIPLSLFHVAIVFTLPVMVVVTLKTPRWGVWIAALGMFAGGGILNGLDFKTSLLMGLGAIHAVVLPQMAYKYLAPRLHITPFYEIFRTNRDRFFFLFFGAFLPSVVITLFCLGMLLKGGYLAPLEFRNLWPLVALATFAATALITPRFKLARKG